MDWSPWPVLGVRPIAAAGRMAWAGWQAWVMCRQPLGPHDELIRPDRARRPPSHAASQQAGVAEGGWFLRTARVSREAGRGIVAGSCEAECHHTCPLLQPPWQHLILRVWKAAGQAFESGVQAGSQPLGRKPAWLPRWFYARARRLPQRVGVVLPRKTAASPGPGVAQAALALGRALLGSVLRENEAALRGFALLSAVRPSPACPPSPPPENP